tara:strand:+ start:2080 stop:2199 length:120 start_codon:yes stop_codon:yes gene_type:complete
MYRYKNQEGGYADDFDRTNYNLSEIAHVDEYRGFIFKEN